MNSSPGPAPSYLVKKKGGGAGERREREAANELPGLKEDGGKFLSSPPFGLLVSLVGYRRPACSPEQGAGLGEGRRQVFYVDGGCSTGQAATCKKPPGNQQSTARPDQRV